MSANNQLIILKKEEMFEIHMNYCVDNDFNSSKNTYLNKRKTLKEAYKFAQKYQREEIVEYGIYIDPSCWSKTKRKADVSRKESGK